MIVFPAERTRSASIWSSFVSTFGTGSATVRHAGMPTVMYTASAKMYAAVGVLERPRTRGRWQAQATVARAGKSRRRILG